MSTPIVTVQKRYGCFGARIGASFNHRLENNLTFPSGRFLKKGSTIFLDLQDATRNTEAAKTAKWVCRHPDCKNIEHASKEALIESHPNNKDLVKDEQAHCYYAVAWLPGVEAKDAKIGKDGAVLEDAIEARLPRVMILSDEE